MLLCRPAAFLALNPLFSVGSVQEFVDFVGDVVAADPDLLHRVAVSQRHGIVLEGVEIDCDAAGCAGFVLTAVAAAD